MHLGLDERRQAHAKPSLHESITGDYSLSLPPQQEPSSLEPSSVDQTDRSGASSAMAHSSLQSSSASAFSVGRNGAPGMRLRDTAHFDLGAVTGGDSTLSPYAAGTGTPMSSFDVNSCISGVDSVSQERLNGSFSLSPHVVSVASQRYATQGSGDVHGSTNCDMQL